MIRVRNARRAALADARGFPKTERAPLGSARAGRDYVRVMSASDSDRRARTAFQQLVIRVAKAGAFLYDFGAGPGIDARFYAEQGFTVGAYEPDPAMCEYFTAYCADSIGAGRVALESGDYAAFLQRACTGAPHRVDLITANFAPLNLVPDLGELFRAFNALTHENGKVLASVLSPYYVGDLKYGWWWRNAGRLCTVGRYSIEGAHGPIIRRSIGEFAARCAPHFELERLYRGVPGGPVYVPAGVDPASRPKSAWLHVLGCRFMFLLFRKIKVTR